MNFSYKSYASEVLFGRDKFLELPTRLKDVENLLIIGSKRVDPIVAELQSKLPKTQVTRIDNIIQHVPVSLVEEALLLLKDSKPDMILAIGGGSAIGLAKAIALETSLPIIAAVTTYSGSEQTPIWGKSTSEGKVTGRTDIVLPRLVIYDPKLTAELPKHITVTSAMNAMAHLVEAVYAPSRNPITTMQALQGMSTIKYGLERIIELGQLDDEANEELLYGAYLGGKCLAEVDMSLHHKTAHVLGGKYQLDHAKVHTVLLPHVLAYQWPYLTSDIQADFQSALGKNPSQYLKYLTKNAGAETDLCSIGFKIEQVDEAVTLMLSNPYPNVAPLSVEKLKKMVLNACKSS
ncbi:maleylacetate reductase [Penaeicola halotolerans]|uniref:maleylacetate reductase n=1 Tax=Penaeicola halotolerans TaxID=2793196 RepID=UPI001CF82053|nr:maleylacetate reductase [Penaeicola halotolerans]